MKLLFLAVGPGGYGETTLGVGLAEHLIRADHNVHFLVHEDSAASLALSRIPHRILSRHALPLVRVIIEATAAAYRPDALVLADYVMTCLSLERARASLAALRRLELPLVAIDTWDLRRTGGAFEVPGERHEVTDLRRLRCIYARMRDDFEDLDLALTPVPLANPSLPGHLYSALPAVTAAESPRGVCEALGLPGDRDFIMFCTAKWQHATRWRAGPPEPAGRLPQLLEIYLRQLGPGVHLLHVGPEAFDIGLDGRYHWLPSLSPVRFDALLGASRLLLTANIASTTIARAIAKGVPVVALANAHHLRTPGDWPEACLGLPSAAVGNWLRGATPFLPFLMWPSGSYDFLEPVLHVNPYRGAVLISQVLNETQVVNTLRALLFDPAARDAARQAQADYVRLLSSLPGPAEHLSQAFRR